MPRTDRGSPKVVGELAGKMLGFSLVTKQTPPEGVVVKKVRSCGAVRCVTAGRSWLRKRWTWRARRTLPS